MSYHTLTHKQVIKYHKDFVLSNPDIYRKERPHHINNTKSTQNPAVSQEKLTLDVSFDKGKIFCMCDTYCLQRKRHKVAHNFCGNDKNTVQKLVICDKDYN